MGLFKKKKDKHPEFTETYKVGSKALFDDNHKLFKGCFATFGLNANEYIEYKDIADISVVEDGNTTSKSGVGGAIGGGILFGPAGAVVGGLASRGKKKKDYAEKLHINIVLTNGVVKTIYLINSKTNKNSFLYKELYKDFLAIGSKLESIINANNNIPTQVSTKDKLFELKELLDAGIITQDEFNNEKTKILSRS